jgi:cytochrome c553
MKKITLLFIAVAVIISATMILNGCAASQTIAAKTGTQLWSENCGRCHNNPSSSDFSGAQWEVIGMHMKLRANLTQDETNKIVTFLQSGN